MLGFALAVSAAVQPQALPPGTVVRQATASVRILPAARISATETPGIAMVREARVRASDGAVKRLRIIEFP